MKAVRIIVSVLLLGYVIVAVAWSRNQAAAELCKGITVDSIGSTFVTPREIRRELGDLPAQAVNTRLHAIDTDSIERMLGSIDKIERVKCYVTTDGCIHIKVTPLDPVVRVFDNNSSYYINRAGKRISADARYHCNVPVISGNFTTGRPATDLLPLVNYISNDSTWSTLITHIKVDSNGDIVLIPMIHGHVINLGDMTALDSKFYRLRRAYREILPVKGWEYYDTLSVKWHGQLVATKRHKRLHQAVSPIDIEAEREIPDIGTMMVDTPKNQ